MTKQLAYGAAAGAAAATVFILAAIAALELMAATASRERSRWFEGWVRSAGGR